MKRFFLVAVSVAVLFLTACSSQNPYPSDRSTTEEDAKAAYEFLLTVDTFSDGAVGYGGTMSEEVKQFQKLYHSKDAKQYFKQLEESATLEGKLYALCALYALDSKEYEKRLEKYQESEEAVHRFSGCIQTEESCSRVVKGFEEGQIPEALLRYIQDH